MNWSKDVFISHFMSTFTTYTIQTTDNPEFTKEIKRNTAFDVIFQFYAVFMISTMRFVIILNDELDYLVNSTI